MNGWGLGTHLTTGGPLSPKPHLSTLSSRKRGLLQTGFEQGVRWPSFRLSDASGIDLQQLTGSDVWPRIPDNQLGLPL